MTFSESGHLLASSIEIDGSPIDPSLSCITGEPTENAICSADATCTQANSDVITDIRAYVDELDLLVGTITTRGTIAAGCSGLDYTLNAYKP